MKKTIPTKRSASELPCQTIFQLESSIVKPESVACSASFSKSSLTTFSRAACSSSCATSWFPEHDSKQSAMPKTNENNFISDGDEGSFSDIDVMQLAHLSEVISDNSNICMRRLFQVNRMISVANVEKLKHEIIGPQIINGPNNN